MHIANELVERKLAACVHIASGVTSIYRWQGSVEKAEETLLTIKTTGERYNELEQAVHSLHPYDTPEIIASPVVAGSKAYCDWVAAETR